LRGWIKGAGLDSGAYGTHSLRRTKAAQIYRKTGNLRAVQLLLGHTKIESTVRYLGIEVDDALALSLNDSAATRRRIANVSKRPRSREAYARPEARIPELDPVWAECARKLPSALPAGCALKGLLTV
jgi:hypothetical protein